MSRTLNAPPAMTEADDVAPRTRVNWTVFIGSAAGILAIAIWAIVDGRSAVLHRSPRHARDDRGDPEGA